MRRFRLFSLVAALLAAGTVSADVPLTLGSPFSESQACSGGSCTRASAPSSATEGLSLTWVRSYVVMVCAASGQTLSGAGTLQDYWCDSRTSLCVRQPDNDLTVTASGVRCQVFAPFVLPYQSTKSDSVVFASSGVTVSGGSTLTVYIYPAS